MPLTPLPSDLARHTWETLCGNALVRQAIQRSIAEGRLPHGLLLHGPRGVGKAGFAVATAKHLIAGSWPPKGEAAERAVRKVERATHPDISYLCPDTRAGRATQIKIEDVREVERLAPLSPIESDHRIVIIDGADHMNPNTANALLKLLEEPPRHCKLLLIAHRRAALLPTVISRCMPLRLAAVPIDELSAWLTSEKGLDPEQARLAARWSDGRPGAALSLPLDEWQVRLSAVGEVMARFAETGYRGVFRAASLLLEQGRDSATEGESPLQAALRWLRMWLRDQLIAATAPAQTALLAQSESAVMTAVWPVECLAALGDEIEALWPLADRSIDAQLAVETILTRAGAAKGR